MTLPSARLHQADDLKIAKTVKKAARKVSFLSTRISLGNRSKREALSPSQDGTDGIKEGGGYMKAAYIFIALCFLLFVWIGLSVIFDPEYPITENAVRVRVVAR